MKIAMQFMLDAMQQLAALPIMGRVKFNNSNTAFHCVDFTNGSSNTANLFLRWFFLRKEGPGRPLSCRKVCGASLDGIRHIITPDF